MSKSPLEELVEYVGPNGPGCRKFERDSLSGYVSKNTVHDDKHPVFRALWWECHGSWLSYGHCYAPNPECPGECGGQRYVPRSRAEAALWLPEAVHAARFSYNLYRSPKDEYAWAVLSVPSPSHKDFVCEEHADNWLDALSATVLQMLKEAK